MARYKFYEDHANKRVICATTYAGKIVKGYAKCAPEDQYAYEKGVDLAMCRVDVKVADKRVRRAESKLKAALQALDEAQAYVERMQEYLDDAMDIQREVYNELHAVEDEFRN